MRLAPSSARPAHLSQRADVRRSLQGDLLDGANADPGLSAAAPARPQQGIADAHGKCGTTRHRRPRAQRNGGKWAAAARPMSSGGGTSRKPSGAKPKRGIIAPSFCQPIL
jgi:hypothetical protein